MPLQYICIMHKIERLKTLLSIKHNCQRDAVFNTIYVHRAYIYLFMVQWNAYDYDIQMNPNDFVVAAYINVCNSSTTLTVSNNTNSSLLRVTFLFSVSVFF